MPVRLVIVPTNVPVLLSPHTHLTGQYHTIRKRHGNILNSNSILYQNGRALGFHRPPGGLVVWGSLRRDRLRSGRERRVLSFVRAGVRWLLLCLHNQRVRCSGEHCAQTFPIPSIDGERESSTSTRRQRCFGSFPSGGPLCRPLNYFRIS